MVQKTRFFPQVHGFKFVNSFQLTARELGLDVLPNGLDILVGPSFGLCGGMCFAALDRFFTERRIESRTDTPGVSDPLFAELAGRQLDSLGNWVWLKVLDWQTSPDMSHWYRKHSVGWRTKQEWPAIKASLDAGIPITLCLICVEGYIANPTDNHQVVAYHYEEAGGRLFIWFYDSNHPEDPCFVSVDFSLDGNNIDARGSHDFIRGFFPISYDRRTIVAALSTARIDGCQFLAASPVASDGRQVRKNEFVMRFSWAANYVPYYTLLLNRFIYVGPGPNGGSGMAYEWQPLPAAGSCETKISTYGWAPALAELQVAGTFSAATELDPPPARVTAGAYVREAELAAESLPAIVDAVESSVRVKDPAPSDQEIDRLVDRLTLVAGDPRGTPEDPLADMKELRAETKSGYIASPAYGRVGYALLFNPTVFHRIARGLIKPDGAVTVIDAGREAVLSQDQLARFQFSGAFSDQDYDQDLFVELNVRAIDTVGQCASARAVRLFAHALLLIYGPVYERSIPQPDWSEIARLIAALVDADVLAKATEGLPPRDRDRIKRHSNDFRMRVLECGQRVLARLMDDPGFRRKAQQERTSVCRKYRHAMAGLARGTGELAEFLRKIPKGIASPWIEEDRTTMMQLVFISIVQELSRTNELRRIIDSLPA